MPVDPTRARDLFLAAAALPAADRPAFLAERCAADADLRAEVEGLLSAAGPLGTTELPPPAQDATGAYDPKPPTRARRAPAGALGSVIAGRYTLLEVIGQGGMGSVYLAEQTEPVKRRVALKLIRAGMDSRQVLARFDAERQALALMDHPNIARVYDGGTTEAGQPFFVMELVQGVALTQYCDQRHLPVEARLRLFVQVCGAVQHAHQKGIIHRDLKPGNVLVTEVDGRPAPKVIDFGIAKATGPGPAGPMALTRDGQLVGTPLYMSPEQAGMSDLDVDTRSDIYSLGVLLYELLTGT
ncbi:MAG TPA: serine/threonine-protein kinase, partial [Gemmataceae bacterium]|nr:serine/threonine-protein kinase [Gemmataceae bacterium]